MFSPVPYDNGQRPVRVSDPVRLTQWPLGAVVVGFGWMLVFSLAEALIIRQLINEEWTAAAWARFLVPQVLVMPFFLRAALRNIASYAYRITLKESEMEIAFPKQPPKRIAYDAIETLGVFGDGPFWLRVQPREGEEIAIPNDGMYSHRNRVEDIVRIAGARLRPEAKLQRDDPPSEENEVARLCWLTLYGPPPVAMEPGKRYRYLPGASAMTHLTLAPFSFAFIMPVSMAVSRVSSMIRAGHWSAFEIGFMLFLALSLIVAVLYVKNWWRADDLFESAPDGLWVIRGQRRFKVTNPQPVYPPFTQFSSARRPILQYGRGWKAFYFDPRFIEEDIPEPWAEEDP